MLHTQGAGKNIKAENKKREAKSFGRGVGRRVASVYVSSLSFLSVGVATDCFCIQMVIIQFLISYDLVFTRF